MVDLLGDALRAKAAVCEGLGEVSFAVRNANEFEIGATDAPASGSKQRGRGKNIKQLRGAKGGSDRCNSLRQRGGDACKHVFEV